MKQFIEVRVAKKIPADREILARSKSVEEMKILQDEINLLRGELDSKLLINASPSELKKITNPLLRKESEILEIKIAQEFHGITKYTELLPGLLQNFTESKLFNRELSALKK